MIVYKPLHKNHFLCLTLGIVIILLLCGLPASASNSEWTAIGLQDSVIEALAINSTTPDTLYAGTNGGGVFKSTNGGSNWTAVNTGLTDKAVHTLAINPATPDMLYAGTTGGGVFAITFPNTWTVFLPVVLRY